MTNATNYYASVNFSKTVDLKVILSTFLYILFFFQSKSTLSEVIIYLCIFHMTNATYYYASGNFKETVVLKVTLGTFLYILGL